MARSGGEATVQAEGAPASTRGHGGVELRARCAARGGERRRREKEERKRGKRKRKKRKREKGKRKKTEREKKRAVGGIRGGGRPRARCGVRPVSDEHTE